MTLVSRLLSLERQKANVSTLPKPTLWSAKIMVRVIRQKILDVRDFQTIQTCSSPQGIDLRTFKSKYGVQISKFLL